MAENPLNKKLLVRPGYGVRIMNAPDGYERVVEPLPEGAAIRQEDGPFDCVILFATNRAEVDRYAPQAIGAVKTGGLLWLCYPKGTSGIKTDINRDKGWDAVRNAGWEGVSLIAIDDKWSAMRFRPASEVKSPRRR